jgi:hypothetical protein
MGAGRDEKTLFGKSEPGFAFGYAEAGRRQKEKVKSKKAKRK